MLIAFNKPYGILSQFTAQQTKHGTLADFDFPRLVYPLGRLDADSEGLLLLTDEPDLNRRLLHPSRHHPRLYFAQVEHVPTEESMHRLQTGLELGGKQALPCHAWILASEPGFPPRIPPIRHRISVPVCWIAIELFEGKNRQVRRMTAAVGHPTLRLVRVRIGGYSLGKLETGKWKILSPEERRSVFL